MHVLRKRACYRWFIMEFGEVPDADMEVLLEKFNKNNESISISFVPICCIQGCRSMIL